MELPRPDDLHLHLRDGEGLVSLMQGARPTTLPRPPAIVSRAHASASNIYPPACAEWPGTFARALVMPNLKPPVTTTADALAYRCEHARR